MNLEPLKRPIRLTRLTRLTLGQYAVLLILSAAVQPAQAQRPEQVGSTWERLAEARKRMLLTEGMAYVAALRVNAMIAAQDAKQPLGLLKCTDPRLNEGMSLNRLNNLKVQACQVNIQAEHQFDLAVLFTNGLAFRADVKTMQQVKPSDLPKFKP